MFEGKAQIARLHAGVYRSQEASCGEGYVFCPSAFCLLPHSPPLSPTNLLLFLPSPPILPPSHTHLLSLTQSILQTAHLHNQPSRTTSPNPSPSPNILLHLSLNLNQSPNRRINLIVVVRWSVNSSVLWGCSELLGETLIEGMRMRGEVFQRRLLLGVDLYWGN